MTYIGNGPNFLVKSIADRAKVTAPCFVGYVFKSRLPMPFPILDLGGWLFLQTPSHTHVRWSLDYRPGRWPGCPPIGRADKGKICAIGDVGLIKP